MTEEEERRHHDAALVDKCCDETPGGDKNRALFSHVPTKALADHLDSLSIVNNPQDFKVSSLRRVGDAAPRENSHLEAFNIALGADAPSARVQKVT